MEIIILSALLLLVAETTYVAYTVSNTSTVTKRKIFVDTSVLIDGRIIPLAETGVIGDTLLIPRSVVGELQLLADGADTEKRARARAGLDVVAELQALESVTVKRSARHDAVINSGMRCFVSSGASVSRRARHKSFPSSHAAFIPAPKAE